MKKIILITLTLLLVSCWQNEMKETMSITDNEIKQKISNTSTASIDEGKLEEFYKKNAKLDTNLDEINNNIEQIDNLNSNLSFTDIINNINNTKEKYRNDNEFNSCLDSSYNNCYFIAVSQNATQKNDKTICNELSTDFAKDECLKTFTVQNAIKSLKMSECENITNDKFYKVNCKYEVAIALIDKNNDLNACNKIYKKDNSKKSSNNNDDTELYDENVFEDTIKMCINTWAYSLAMKTKEIKYCLKLEDENQKDMCKNDVKSMLEMEK